MGVATSPARRRVALGVAIAVLVTVGGAGAVQVARVTLGEQPAGGYLVSTNQMVAPIGVVRRTDGDRPKDVALSPDGKTVAVRCVNAVRLFSSAGEPLGVVSRGAGPLGIAWAPDGRALYSSTSNGKVVRVDLAPDGKRTVTEFEVEDSAAGHTGNPQTAGVAVSPDGKKLYVALGIRNAVAVLNMPDGDLAATIPVGVCPYRIALSKDGSTLFAANRGGRIVPESRSTQMSGGTPVRIDRSNDSALKGSVTIVDTATLASSEVEVGRQPSAMAVTSDGSRLYVANSDDDTVSVLDAKRKRVIDTIGLRPQEDPGFGQMPTSLALSGDEKALYVACGGGNAVAIVKLDPKPGVAGYVPTGWFPVALAERDGRLYVASSKGIGSRPNMERPRYGVHASVGAVQFIAPEDLAPLQDLTRQVARNNRWGVEQPARQGVAAVPIPERVGEPSVFKHVIYIIKENHTYDSTLGDMPEGNGDKSLCLFGEESTPNQHKLARDFVLLDNTYTSGTNSADGHQWTSSSVCNAYQEQNYSSSARSYPYDGGDPLSNSPAGFLWNAAARSRLSVRVYGEFVNKPQIEDTQARAGARATEGGRGADRGTVTATRKRSATWTELWNDYKTGGKRFRITAHTDNASLRPVLHPNFIGFPQIVSDQWRADQFLAEFRQFEKSGRLPALTIMLLPNNHTSGTSAGMPTPRAAVADNDLALGRIVEAVSKSRYWRDTLILVIEDDSQLGLDHVDGHRTIAFCASAYTKRGAVVSDVYNHTSLIRTMELVLGMPAINRFDRTATPLTACFTATPDLAHYTAVPNRIPLDEMNKPATALRGAARRLAVASSKQDWSDVDRANPRVVAEAAWYSVWPRKPFPGASFRPPDDGDGDED